MSCVSATMCTTAAMPRLLEPCCKKKKCYFVSPCCTARQKMNVDEMKTNMWLSRFNWTDHFCFCFAANQETSRCRRIQMSDEVMSLSRCSDSEVVSFKYVSSALFLCAFKKKILLRLPVCKPSMCVVISQYAPLSLRPLTCEVKAGHRWGPREQGCIQFQPRKRSILEKDDFMMNILLLRKSCFSVRCCLWYCHDYVMRIQCHILFFSVFTVCLWGDQDLEGWTRTRGSLLLLLQHRHSQGANPIDWLCVIALNGGQ